MGNYKFPLQKLLDIRIKKEDESKRNFIEAQRQQRIVEQKLRDLKDNYKKYNTENPEDDLFARRIKDNYLNALTKNIKLTANDLQRHIEFVEQKRKELVAKQVEKKTVETLKEKRTLAFNHEQDETERKSNDEFGLYAYMRNTEGR